MSLLENLLAPGTIERLGWMLVHVLWQATAVAILLAVFLRLLHKASANVRYWTACAALALMVALPIVTIRWMKAPGPVAEAGPPPVTVTVPAPAALPAAPATVEIIEEMPSSVSAPTPASAPLPAARLPIPAVPLQERIVSTLEPALPYVVLGWLVGVFGLSAWHLGGWAQLQRLKRRMVRAVEAPLQRRLDELMTRLGVHRVVGLLESALVEVPTVVGWLRPVILLPASALTGLSPDQLEGILAHELAHVRRYDYLVNIVQTIVEILGFYHPAIWWVSHRIRIERENCCDDLAVHVCGSSLQYARALACMEEIRHTGTDLAVAATGGSLMARIARLLGRPAVDDRRFAWLPGLITLLLVVGIVASHHENIRRLVRREEGKV
jgi:beta-lactamase regulating signal transducer with metallopeptidase domain